MKASDLPHGVMKRPVPDLRPYPLGGYLYRCEYNDSARLTGIPHAVRCCEEVGTLAAYLGVDLAPSEPQ